MPVRAMTQVPPTGPLLLAHHGVRLLKPFIRQSERAVRGTQIRPPFEFHTVTEFLQSLNGRERKHMCDLLKSKCEPNEKALVEGLLVPYVMGGGLPDERQKADKPNELQQLLEQSPVQNREHLETVFIEILYRENTGQPIPDMRFGRY